MGRSSRQGAIPSELAWLIDELDDFADRLRTLEAPSGESLGNNVAKLQNLVANIQTQLDAWTATRWTNAEITAQINAAIAAAFAGNVSITGSLTVNGALAAASLSTGGGLSVGGTVSVPGARGTSVATASGRVAAWIAGDGRLGHTA